jgi:hypothetical protein
VVNDGLMNRRVGIGRFLMDVTAYVIKALACGAKLGEAKSFSDFVEPKLAGFYAPSALHQAA